MRPPFDEAALVHPWRHPDPRVDRLCEELQTIVHRGEKCNQTRMHIFGHIEEVAFRAADRTRRIESSRPVLVARAAIPYLNEPWYC